MEAEFDKYQDDYVSLAKLVLFSTWLESTFSEMGGEGNGIWEKFNNISYKFPLGLENKIINLAEVRNHAVHNSPSEKEIERIKPIQIKIEQIINDRLELDKQYNILLQKEVQLKKSYIVKIFINIDKTLKDEIVKEYEGRCTSCGEESFKKLLLNIESYKKYLKKKKIWSYAIFVNILFFIVYYILVK
jgi:hypothetical protein